MTLRILLAGILTAAALRADCQPRKFTPAEEKTAARVLQTLQEAFSPAPQGWKSSLPDQPFRASTACAGDPPAQTDYIVHTATYSIINPSSRRRYPEEDEVKRLQDERDALTRLPDSWRQRVNAVQARVSEKIRASRAAERAGNREEASRLRREADEIDKEIAQIRKEYEGTIAPKLAEIDSRVKQLQNAIPKYDTRVWVRLIVSARAKPYQPDPEPGKRLNGDAYLWKRAGATPYAGAVNRVVLLIEGWPDYREMVTSLIDMKKLAALVE